jgi:hypothetical protein
MRGERAVAAAWIWRRFRPSPRRSRSSAARQSFDSLPSKAANRLKIRDAGCHGTPSPSARRRIFGLRRVWACHRPGLDRMITERRRRRACARSRLIGRLAPWRHIVRHRRHRDRTGQKGWPSCRSSCGPAAQAERGRRDVTAAHRRAASGTAPVRRPAPGCGTVRSPRRTARRGTRCSQGPSAACSSRR